MCWKLCITVVVPGAGRTGHGDDRVLLDNWVLLDDVVVIDLAQVSASGRYSDRSLNSGEL